MPWIALFAIVVCGWLVLAVGGGWLIGRVLGMLEHDDAAAVGDAPADRPADDVRRAA